MTGGSRPTPDDVAAAFGAAGEYETTRPETPAIVSEYAAAGSAIQSSALAAEALAALKPEHFTDGSCRVVLEAVQALDAAGQPVEPQSVLAELARAGLLARVTGPDMGTGGAFLHSLVRRAGEIGYHAPRVRGEAVRLGMRAALVSCEQITRGAGWDPETALDSIRKRIDDAASGFAARKVLRPQSEVAYEVLDALENQEDPGLSTGYSDLDEAIGGLRPGELIVVGARPGTGKTLIGLGIADHVGTRLGLPVLFSSLEMREEELTHRRIAAAAKVPLHSIVRHQLAEGDWGRIARAQERITNTRLYIDDTPNVGPGHMRGQIRAMDRAGNMPRLHVIDYLGYMAAPKAESRQQAVAELARASKNIAREFGIPVVLLAQLNRGPESRHDKRPNLADLRESGEIEQSADIALLLHREDAYVPESPRAGEIDVIIAKNRQGPLCTVTMCFQGHFGRITGMSREDIPDGEWTPSSAIRRAA